MRLHALAISTAAVLLIALALAAPSQARQIRVEVGAGGLQFTPRAANVNPGDNVVWIWTVVSPSHTVTSGDSAGPTPDGLFDSGLMDLTTNGAFSYRVLGAGTYLYYCQPHAPFMAGRVIANATTGLPLSDFRLTEVFFGGTASSDLIEITNFGPGAGDLGRYRIVVNGVDHAVTPTSYSVPASGQVVIHPTAGTNTATDLFLPAIGDLPDIGTLALYVPNSKAGTTLNDATQMIDFVEWGASPGALEVIAIANGFWSAAQSIDNVNGAAGHSISFCGLSGQYGPTHWAEIAVPNFGTGLDCSTPALRSTWGRIEALYHRR